MLKFCAETIGYNMCNTKSSICLAFHSKLTIEHMYLHLKAVIYLKYYNQDQCCKTLFSEGIAISRSTSLELLTKGRIL